MPWLGQDVEFPGAMAFEVERQLSMKLKRGISIFLDSMCRISKLFDNVDLIFKHAQYPSSNYCRVTPVSWPPDLYNVFAAELTMCSTAWIEGFMS